MEDRRFGAMMPQARGPLTHVHTPEAPEASFDCISRPTDTPKGERGRAHACSVDTFHERADDAST
eukprot:15081867-Alexandrium_andersonii.AAC.1